MKTYCLATAIKEVEKGRNLCLRPLSCVGTGNGVMYTIRGRYIDPQLPPHTATLLGRWVVQTIAAVEREEAERRTGL